MRKALASISAGPPRETQLSFLENPFQEGDSNFYRNVHTFCRKPILTHKYVDQRKSRQVPFLKKVDKFLSYQPPQSHMFIFSNYLILSLFLKKVEVAGTKRQIKLQETSLLPITTSPLFPL